MSASQFLDVDSFQAPDSKYFRSNSTKKISADMRCKRSCSSGNTSMLSCSSGPESKYYKMKKLVVAVKEYLQSSTEEVASLINRYLQALSVTIDLSIFDPHTNIASEFFVSLYELMSKIEPRSTFSWNCVDVLTNVCRNSSARLALIHIYQFIPSLSRILGEQLSNDKKIRLLKLIQDLTCGIKISWQIPHLPHLMTTLARWVEIDNEEIVGLSLGILVNLCYKNLPAIYILTSCVKIKKLIRTCLAVKGPIVEAHACRLLIICDHLNEMGPSSFLLKLVNITFLSMKKAFEARDYIFLRQLVEFYIDVKKKNTEGENGELTGQYEAELGDLLKVLETTTSISNSEEGQGDIYNLGECIAMIFQFIYHLIETNMECLIQFHPRFIKLSLDWIHNETVAPHSIAILKTIALNTPLGNTEVLKPLGINLPVFMMTLDSVSYEDIPTHSEHNKKVGALLQLLRVLLRVDHLRPKILNELKSETMNKVFYPLLGDDSPRLRASELNNCSEEAVNLFTHAIVLVYELAKYSDSWTIVRENLLQQRQIQHVLSQALYSGSAEVKALILEISSLPTFPRQEVANTMSSIHSLMALNTPPPSKNHNVVSEISTPVLSVNQVEKFDELIEKMKEIITNRNFVDISTSDVMELYEYKLASMGHAQRAAMASVEAASEQCTHLQHRLAQLTAETNRLQQMLFQTQQKREEISKARQDLEELVQARTHAFEAEKSRYKVLHSKYEKVQETLDDVSKRLQETNESKEQLEEQQKKLKHLVSKLEENCSRLEKNLLKKEDALKKSTMQNEELRMQTKSLEQQLSMKHDLLEKKNSELHETLEDLKIKKSIIDTITKVAQQQR